MSDKSGYDDHYRELLKDFISKHLGKRIGHIMVYDNGIVTFQCKVYLNKSWLFPKYITKPFMFWFVDGILYDYDTMNRKPIKPNKLWVIYIRNTKLKRINETN